MPAGCVYVGRPTKYGNPFRPYSRCTIQTPRIREAGTSAFRSMFSDSGDAFDVETRSIQDCLIWYRWWASIAAYDDPQWLAPLYRQDLCCWCPLDRPCHADILLELAAAKHRVEKETRDLLRKATARATKHQVKRQIGDLLLSEAARRTPQSRPLHWSVIESQKAR